MGFVLFLGIERTELAKLWGDLAPDLNSSSNELSFVTPVNPVSALCLLVGVDVYFIRSLLESTIFWKV